MISLSEPIIAKLRCENNQATAFFKSPIIAVTAVQPNVQLKELYDTFEKLQWSDDTLNRLTRDFTGRNWFFKELDQWLELKKGNKIYLITGDPGSGKTAVMGKILDRYRDKVAAYHFCESSWEDTLKPRNFIYSIAAQLANKFPRYRQALEVAWQKIGSNDSLVMLLNVLIIKPFSEEKPIGVTLIIVDALDEAWKTGNAESIPQIIKVLALKLADLSVRLIVTTRKETQILTCFSAFKPHEILTNQTGNLQDVQTFLRKKFLQTDLKQLLKERRANIGNVIRTIGEKAAGNFLYVQQMIEAIQEGQIDPQYPERFPPGLDGLYLDFFQRTFTDQRHYQDEIRPLLDIICAANEPLTGKQVAEFIHTGTAFQMEQRLEMLTVYFPKQNGVYQSYHKSIIDWLTADNGNSYFRVDVDNGHKLIGDTLLNLYNGGAREEFIMRYLLDHLLESSQWDKCTILLSSLQFIEDKCKCAEGMAYSLIEDYNKSESVIPLENHGMFIDFAHFVRSQSHVLTRYPEMTFQQAFNEPDASAVVQAAVELAKFGRSEPWLRLVNKSQQGKSACLLTLIGHTDVVNYCSYSPDGCKIVSVSDDKTIKTWDAATGEKEQTLTVNTGDINFCGYSPDGCKIVSVVDDKTIKIWDAATGEKEQILTGHTDDINFCGYSPDGYKIVSASDDGTIKIWDVTTGQVEQTLIGHINAVTFCSYSPDGNKIMSASLDDTIKIWDVFTGLEEQTLTGHTRKITSCNFSPDGKKIVSASWDNTIKIWDAVTGQEEQTLIGHTGWVTSCAYSPDGNKIVSASCDYTIKIWDVATGQEEQTLIGHTGWVTSCAYSPDGGKIISASDDKTMKIWDFTTRQEEQTCTRNLNAINSCAYSLDGSRILSASDDETVTIWNVATGQKEQVLTGHTNTVTTCVYSPCGSKIMSASDDSTIKIWNATTGQEEQTLASIHKDWVNSCAYSPDGSKIVSALQHGTMKIWDVATGKEEQTLTGHTHLVTSCAYSPDGSKIVSASKDMTIKIWNVVTGREEQTLTGHTNWVTSCSYSPDGSKIVSASDDNTIRIWDSVNGQEEQIISGHTDGVTYCSYSPDGSKIVSASYDKTMKIWDTTTWQEILRIFIDDFVWTISWSMDGMFLAGAGKLGKLYIWELMNMGNTKKNGNNKIEVFLSYSHKDEDLCNELRKQLRVLERKSVIACFHDFQIMAGIEWEPEILGHLERAQIIILLISADFVDSDYCWDKEMRRAMERHERGEARVIPVILRPVDWQEAPFGKLKALPKDGKPVTAWDDRDSAFLDIVQGIKKYIC